MTNFKLLVFTKRSCRNEITKAGDTLSSCHVSSRDVRIVCSRLKCVARTSGIENYAQFCIENSSLKTLLNGSKDLGRETTEGITQ
jgi:hypothetical protein